jgi:hypothetical protein
MAATHDPAVGVKGVNWLGRLLGDFKMSSSATLDLVPYDASELSSASATLSASFALTPRSNIFEYTSALGWLISTGLAEGTESSDVASSPVSVAKSEASS